MPKFNLGQTVWYTYYVNDSPGDIDVYSGEIRSIDASDENCIRYSVDGRTCFESELFETKEEAAQSLRTDVLEITYNWQRGLADFFVRFYKEQAKYKKGDTVYLSQVDFYRSLVRIVEAEVTDVFYNWTNGSVQYMVEWDNGNRSTHPKGSDIYATREEAVAAALEDCEKHLEDLKRLIEDLKNGKV